MDAMENLLTRRSCRAYKDEPVSDDAIYNIVRAGLYAPSGMGRQSAIVVVVTDKAVRDQLSRMNAEIAGMKEGDPFYGAPVVLVVLADRTVPTHVEDGALMMGRRPCGGARILLDPPRPGRVRVARRQGAPREARRQGRLRRDRPRDPRRSRRGSGRGARPSGRTRLPNLKRVGTRTRACAEIDGRFPRRTVRFLSAARRTGTPVDRCGSVGTDSEEVDGGGSVKEEV